MTLLAKKDNTMKRPRTGVLLVWFCGLLAGALSQPSAAEGVPVLLYHEISTPEHSIQTTCDVVNIGQFREQMEYLHSHGYKSLSTAELVYLVSKRAEMPDRRFVVHFDDGRKSVREALPVLEQYGVKATFWIIASRIGAHGYLDWSEVADLARNPSYEIYSHTLTHPNLVQWAEAKHDKGWDDIDRELSDSKKIIERGLSRPVPYLAWPMGAYSPALIDAAVGAGYVALFTTDRGNIRTGDDPLRLKRSWVAAFHNMDVFANVVQGKIVGALVSEKFPCSW